MTDSTAHLDPPDLEAGCGGDRADRSDRGGDRGGLKTLRSEAALRQHLDRVHSAHPGPERACRNCHLLLRGICYRLPGATSADDGPLCNECFFQRSGADGGMTDYEPVAGVSVCPPREFHFGTAAEQRVSAALEKARESLPAAAATAAEAARERERERGAVGSERRGAGAALAAAGGAAVAADPATLALQHERAAAVCHAANGAHLPFSPFFFTSRSPFRSL